MKVVEAFEPASEAAAADFIRHAHEAATPIAVAGAGTRLGYGRPMQAEKGISSEKLSGVVEYNPAELVITAKAGTPLAEIGAALEKEGQRLVFEPMDHRPLFGSDGEPTIGAVAAGNISGPRRIVAGAARDSLLGVRFVNGNGEIVKNGGRVMKNVTGLDLVKLMAGSWGTLGFLTEVTFKVLPVTETETTLLIRGLDDATAIVAMAHAMATSTEVSGAAHLPEMIAATVADGTLGGAATTCLRLEGFESSVALRADALKALLGKSGEIEEISGDASRRVWRDIRDCVPFADGTDKPVWRVSMKPSEAPDFVMALRMKAGAAAFYDWQGGLVWLRMEADPQDDVIRAELARHGGGHATLVRADSQYRLLVPVFQPQPPAVEALTRRIKLSFDPKQILNPGRMALGV